MSRMYRVLIVTLALVVSCRPIVTRVDMPSVPASDLTFVILEAGRLPLRAVGRKRVRSCATECFGDREWLRPHAETRLANLKLKLTRPGFGPALKRLEHL